ncbi:uncharacterized protein V1518DRAFT_422199 [Limtongia smithiae]|uniref:uncharacterized protein n=1 Tax=Limtongia smithiae TaxID=1125753 RepID=UPI0034CF12EC
MHSYLEHILESFHAATGWNTDSQYVNLTASSNELLDFSLPSGFNLNVSSLTTGSSASSYSIRNLGGLVDGAIAFYYSAPPDILVPGRLQSEDIELAKAFCGYRRLKFPDFPEDDTYREVWQGGWRVDPKNTLLYGKIYLPSDTLEAQYIRQMSPTSQLVVSAVSDRRLRDGGAILTQFQRNMGKWCTEYIYSTSEAMVGFRGLYSFTGDTQAPPPANSGSPHQPSFLSAGGEIYYGILNKAAGVSTGLRYTTSSPFVNSPMTMTLTLNPIMGQLSAAYAVQASTNTTFASRFDFNAFSYESDLTLGCELWQRSDSEGVVVAPPSPVVEAGAEPRAEPRAEPDAPSTKPTGRGEPVPALAVGSELAEVPSESVWKLRMSTGSPSVRVLWEGRVKSFLLSVGTEIDVRPGQGGIRTIGLGLLYAA